MRYTLYIILLATTMLFTNCKQANGQKVKITTPMGTMTVLLYPDVAIHAANFKKLAADGEYNGMLFHRVIRNFMIQGGDPDSKNAKSNDRLGQNQIGGPIDAEIIYPKYFHKYGALAAARKPDAYNPNKMSSGSQFYIVKGEVLTDTLLSIIEAKMNNRRRQKIFYDVQHFYADSLQYYQDNHMPKELADLQVHILGKVEELLKEKGEFKYTPEQREAYTTIGGTPHLDGEYTVFGEVIDGFDVLDAISAVETWSPGDRPMEDIWMQMEVVE